MAVHIREVANSERAEVDYNFWQAQGLAGNCFETYASDLSYAVSMSAHTQDRDSGGNYSFPVYRGENPATGLIGKIVVRSNLSAVHFIPV